jgi:hypothetical protein
LCSARIARLDPIPLSGLISLRPYNNERPWRLHPQTNFFLSATFFVAFQIVGREELFDLKVSKEECAAQGDA